MLSFIYNQLTTVRNRLYDDGIIPIIELEKPVVAIGNLTVGGTGKTPFLDLILHRLIEAGYSPGIISRGYRGSFTGVQKVRMTPDVFFGDEPEMLHYRNPKVPIYVHPAKVRAAKHLLNNETVDVLLADDAFQHRRIHRVYNILLVDLTEPSAHYKLLPFGRARENLKGLRRADAIIFTKGNLLNPEEKQIRMGMISKWPISDKTITTHAKFQLGPLYSFSDQEPITQDKTVFAVSGIGRPHSFFESLVQSGWKVLGERAFKDHHDFTLKDVAECEKLAEGSDVIAITEKDYIKLQKLDFDRNRWVVAPLEVKLDNDEIFRSLFKVMEQEGNP